MDKIIQAKIVLYRHFLQTAYSDLSKDEIEIGYILARDRDIQAILSKEKRAAEQFAKSALAKHLRKMNPQNRPD